ncbi:hypothetical protein [Streptomyces nanshensis]|uniref:Uncharacterized protein n=1 Tax=Streptomyces nanshensis TaxID=518642 RepID=A0A1E7LC79_9ACTN|nr:hypothetical protein [Streptomyces nanshensis]OEV13815.1 hypothetical protein AN218_01910 [Streptomyces nanshensis]
MTRSVETIKGDIQAEAGRLSDDPNHSLLVLLAELERTARQDGYSRGYDQAQADAANGAFG